MRLVILTQVLDRDDAVLGFFHGWCARFAQEPRVDELVVVAQQVGRVGLPPRARVVSLGRESGAGRTAMAGRLLATLLGLPRRTGRTAVLGHMVPRFVLNAAPACWVRRFPLYLWYTHKAVDRSLRLAAPLVRKVFTASPESFRLPSSAGKRVVTGHGIDCAHFAPGTGERPVDLLVVGRIAPSKGQLELLDALSGLDPVPRTEIVGDILLDGDRAYRDEVLRRAAGMGGRVTCRGALPWPAVADAMRAAKVLVNVSRTGSVDKVVLEAMAAGALPLTGNESFASVLPAALQPALMFRLGDARDLATRLTALLALPGERRGALAASLRQIVLDGHDLERLVPRLVAEMESPA